MRRRSRRRPPSSFSLVELLAVMAVLSLLAAASLPMLRGVSAGMDLRGAAGLMQAQFDLARQTAAGQNLATEVRIYQDAGNGPWRTLALVLPMSVSGQSSDRWITPGEKLPGDVVVDTQYSNLTEETAPTNGVEAGGPPVPYPLRNRNYFAFRFLPGGGTDLAAMTNNTWCLTLKWLHSPSPRNDGHGPADNYVSVVIDPRTGHTTLFQP